MDALQAQIAEQKAKLADPELEKFRAKEEARRKKAQARQISPEEIPLLPFSVCAVDFLRTANVTDYSNNGSYYSAMCNAIADFIEELCPPQGLPGRKRLTEEEKCVKFDERYRLADLVYAQMVADKMRHGAYGRATKKVAEAEDISDKSLKKALTKRDLRFMLNRDDF